MTSINTRFKNNNHHLMFSSLTEEFCLDNKDLGTQKCALCTQESRAVRPSTEPPPRGSVCQHWIHLGGERTPQTPSADSCLRSFRSRKSAGYRLPVQWLLSQRGHRTAAPINPKARGHPCGASRDAQCSEAGGPGSVAPPWLPPEEKSPSALALGSW